MKHLNRSCSQLEILKLSNGGFWVSGLVLEPNHEWVMNHECSTKRQHLHLLLTYKQFNEINRPYIFVLLHNLGNI